MFVYPRQTPSSYSPFCTPYSKEEYYQALAEEHARQAALARERERQHALRRALLQRRLEEQVAAEREAHINEMYQRPRSMYDSYLRPASLFEQQQERGRRVEEARLKARAEAQQRAAERETASTRFFDALFGQPTSPRTRHEETVDMLSSNTNEPSTTRSQSSSSAEDALNTHPQVSYTEKQRNDAAQLIQTTWRDHHLRSRSYSTLTNLDFKFTSLKAGFVFPATLDFASSDSTVPALLYTSTNAPLHAYEHDLTSLLTQLDAVESHGDKRLREERKRVVKAIEKELEALDDQKADVWRRLNSEGVQVAEESKKAKVEAGGDKEEDEDVPMGVQTAPVEHTEAVKDISDGDPATDRASADARLDTSDSTPATDIPMVDTSLPKSPATLMLSSLPDSANESLSESKPISSADTPLNGSLSIHDEEMPVDVDHETSIPQPEANSRPLITQDDSELTPAYPDDAPLHPPTDLGIPSVSEAPATLPLLVEELHGPDSHTDITPDSETETILGPSTPDTSRSPSWPVSSLPFSSESDKEWADDHDMTAEMQEVEDDLVVNALENDDDGFVML